MCVEEVVGGQLEGNGAVSKNGERHEETRQDQMSPSLLGNGIYILVPRYLNLSI